MITTQEIYFFTAGFSSAIILHVVTEAVYSFVSFFK